MAQILVVDQEPSFAFELTRLLARFGDQVTWIGTTQEAVSRLRRGDIDLLVLDQRVTRGSGLNAFEDFLRARRPPTILMSGARDVDALIEVYRRGIAYCVIKPYHARELVSCLYAVLRQQQRIVCLGGGTGLYTLLLGLKTLPNVHLTSVVNMSDDGGSTGRIREAFGILPPGDVRRSLVALSTAPSLMNELMRYRLPAGEGLKDHNLGNLFLAAVADLKGSMAEAVQALSEILNIQGIVLPVTTTLNTLMAECVDGSIVQGEHRIDVPADRDPNLRIARIWQEPEAEAAPNAIAALLAADVITIGPGDLYTSLLATLVVKDIAAAIRASRARKIYLCNLMTKPGETSGFTVADHIREVVRYLGEDVLDEVVASNTPLSQEALEQYAKKHQEPVRLDDASVLRHVTKARIVMQNIGSERELVRHDSMKLAGQIAQLAAASSGQPAQNTVSPPSH